MKSYLILYLILFFSISIFSQSINPVFIKSVPIVKTNESITIDAKLDEKTWLRPGFTGMVQQDPVQGVEPTQHSEMWIAYDDNAFYFAAKYYDTNPDSIIARLVRRDYIWGDPSDGCVLYLDPLGDKRTGYFFYVSAAGGIADGLIENDVKQPNDLTWDAVWEGSANIEADGWSIEMRIPFSQIRFTDSQIQNWGINVERFLSRNAETDMLAFTPRNESGFVSRYPLIVGIEGIHQSTKLEILPYITGKAEYIKSFPNDPFNDGSKYEPGAGLDVRAALGSSLTLNATINPDFGQVEVDPAVVNLTDVESTFEEKRPFFTEGVNIFRFGRGGMNNFVNINWQSPNIFYSRRIGRAPQGYIPMYDYADIPSGTHILGAAKVTGKIFDNWEIGTIHALTKREIADYEISNVKSDLEVEPLTYYGVLRARRDFNSGKQGIGILSTFTNRFFKDDNLRSLVNKDALVAALDGWTFLDDNRTYVLSGWGALSRVSGATERMIALQRNSGHYFQRPDDNYVSVDSSLTSMTGYAGRIQLNKNRGAILLNSAIGFISPKFENNDLGFNSYSDIINMHVYTGYMWNDPTQYYQNASLTFSYFSNYNFDGINTAAGIGTSANITFPDLYGANANFTYYPQTFNARKTRGGPLTVNPISKAFSCNFYTDNRLWWVLNPGFYYRTGEDSKSMEFYTYFEFKLSPTLTLQVTPDFLHDKMNTQWVTAYSDLKATNTFNKRYVFANLDQKTFATEIRLNYIISPKLSLQVYLQPLIASGKYSKFKFLANSKSYNYIIYGEKGSVYNKRIDELGNVSYVVSADEEETTSILVIGNPDFNYISLRGSAVLRWEYLPGSTMYFVWTQNREDMESNGDFQFGNSMSTMFSTHPDNIFMVKISYWL